MGLLCTFVFIATEEGLSLVIKLNFDHIGWQKQKKNESETLKHFLHLKLIH